MLYISEMVVHLPLAAAIDLEFVLVDLVVGWIAVMDVVIEPGAGCVVHMRKELESSIQVIYPL